jgi:hypothetical protein
LRQQLTADGDSRRRASRWRSWRLIGYAVLLALVLFRVGIGVAWAQSGITGREVTIPLTVTTVGIERTYRTGVTRCSRSGGRSGFSGDAVQTSIVRACEVCSAEAQGRRMATCSDRRRSERWRRWQEQARCGRDARVADLLREAVRLLEVWGK